MARLVFVPGAKWFSCHIFIILIGTAYIIASPTLHMNSHLYDDLLDSDMHNVVISGHVNSEVLRRSVRSVRSQPGTTNVPNMTDVTLNDSHVRMLIHWIGKGSPVVVALTRDFNVTRNSTSKVHISRDYGRSFREVQASLMHLVSGRPSLIDCYYKSPLDNNRLIFTDLLHRYIFTTTNCGRSFHRRWVPFAPRQIVMSRANSNIMYGFDKRDALRRIWLSTNFGNSWRPIQFNVEFFYTGGGKHDPPHTVYALRTMSHGRRFIVYSPDFFNSTSVLLRDVVEFKVTQDYIFATVASTTNAGMTSLQLWVSYERGMFQKVEFPGHFIPKAYIIADASEGQVFVGLVHEKNGHNVTDLYISEAMGHMYTLSLPSVVTVPHTRWPWNLTDMIVDMHKVDGLRGVYIISQLHESIPHQTPHQLSLITYNKGASWRRLTTPTQDSLGDPINCHTGVTQNCSLHLMQNYHALRSRTVGILSSEFSIGLIVATGIVSDRLSPSLGMSSSLNVYMSRNGGFTWDEVLKGPHIFAMADHGGLLVAVNQREPTEELLYSTNEGRSWSRFVFSSRKVYVINILTEPGQKTTVFSVFGVEAAGIDGWTWTIKTIDLKPVFGGRQCGDGDFRTWSPSGDAHSSCLLGQKMLIQRRRVNTLCYNGRDFDRVTSVVSCACREDDYECDFGYERVGYYSRSSCQLMSPSSGHDQIPQPCPEGTAYNRTKGYRRVAGNQCQGGLDYLYDPVPIACPVRGNEEFIVFSSRTSVYRKVFASRHVESLPIPDLGFAVSLDYDYVRNCVYWADSEKDQIQRLCLNGNSTVETLITEGTDNIEGLAYDWMSGSLFWLDAGHRRLELARAADGSHRRVLIQNPANGTGVFDRPRALTLSPKHGLIFWSDWSSTRPRIMSAWMDGTHISVVTENSSRVYWPNGLAVDEDHERLYWTDAHLDSIAYCSFNGSGYHLVVRDSARLPHPYALDIYKDRVYWTDWQRGSVLATNKYHGGAISVVVEQRSQLFDLKILHQDSQRGRSGCGEKGACESLCVELPPDAGLAITNKTRGWACLCSDDFAIKKPQANGGEACACNDGENRTATGCYAQQSNCSQSEFECRSGQCILSSWHCDRDNDCGDNSDEIGCAYRQCSSAEFACRDGVCIPSHWICDGENDCHDGSDEFDNCTTSDVCSSSEFHCANGRCVNAAWRCDGDNDCYDGSDEMHCPHSHHNATCPTHYFSCVHSGGCMPHTFVCDGDADCRDGSDEMGCNVTHTCHHDQITCDGNRCVWKLFVCNGQRDCLDGSDERNCPTQHTDVPPTMPSCDSYTHFICLNQRCIPAQLQCNAVDDCGDNSDEDHCHYLCHHFEFQCANGSCIPIHLHCDGRTDCSDGSDEMFCHPYTTPTMQCPDNDFRCSSGECIYMSDVCDGHKQCPGGEDELNCDGAVVKCDDPEHFECEMSGGCVPAYAVCDGKRDCLDNSDEIGCKAKAAAQNRTCEPYEFQCSDGRCIVSSLVCNGEQDCRGGEDEVHCNFSRRIVYFYLEGVGATSLKVGWRANERALHKSYWLPLQAMYRQSPRGQWQNISLGMQNLLQHEHERHHLVIRSLRPKTRYEYTFLVRTEMMPSKLVSTEVPTKFMPQNVTATNRLTGSSSFLLVTWNKPVQSNGDITHYVVYYKDINSTRHVEQSISTESAATYASLRGLIAGHKYTIRVAAYSCAEDVRSTPINATYSPLVADCVRASVILSHTMSVAIFDWRFTQHADHFEAVAASAETLHVKTVRVPFKKGKPLYHVAVKGLLEGIKYDLFVRTVIGSTTRGPCPGTIDTFKIPGEAEDIPEIIHMGLNSERSINVRWQPVGKAEAKYQVYFSTDSHHLTVNDYTLNEAQSLTTSDTELTLRDLVSCEDYFVRVQKIAPIRGRLSRIRSWRTDRDDTSPPKNVRVKEIKKTAMTADVQVTWDAACDYNAFPRSYIIVLVLDGIDNGVKTERVNQTRGISHVVKKLKRGATYNISVLEFTTLAKPSLVVQKTIAPYPAPEEFKVFCQADNTVFLVWDRPAVITNDSIMLSYEIEHARWAFNKKSSFHHFATVGATQYSARGLRGDTEHVFRVRIHSIYGYPGLFTQPLSVFTLPLRATTPSSATASSHTTVLILGLCAGSVIVVLVMALAAYAIRHKRLQRSFTSFASREYTQYDARSGTTSFGVPEGGAEGEGEGLGDDDALLIHGFSDDEPLIVA